MSSRKKPVDKKEKASRKQSEKKQSEKKPVEKKEKASRKKSEKNQLIKKKSKGGGGDNKVTLCNLPTLILTDSYKLSHQLMYPPGVKKMVAYGECRGPLKIDGKNIVINKNNENRLVNFGLRYIIENYIDKVITEDDINKVLSFYSKHGFLGSPYPLDENLLKDLIGKKPPIKIYGLPEGTVMLPKTPVYVIEAEEQYAPFVTYYETILTMIWYPIAVASLSRCCKEIFTQKYIDVGLDNTHYFINYSLHDFGFRGCSSIETSIIGGMSHLLNFKGTDTLSAAYYATYNYNQSSDKKNGGTLDNFEVKGTHIPLIQREKPLNQISKSIIPVQPNIPAVTPIEPTNINVIGESVAASEHSVMTSYKREFDAYLNILRKFGDKGAPVAIVMDSYNYENALFNVFPAAVKSYINERKNKGVSPVEKQNKTAIQYTDIDQGIFGNKPILTDEDILYLPNNFAITFRPDSGNPSAAVIQSLIAGVKLFGISEDSYEHNGIKYIIPRFVRTIQGDGINVFTIQNMLDVITTPNALGNGTWAFAPFSLLCGMGGGLLQKVNRDSVNFATKLCFVEYGDGKTPYINNKGNKIVMKAPATDKSKSSHPGKPYVIINKPGWNNVPCADVTSTRNEKIPYGNALKLFYNGISGTGISQDVLKNFTLLKETVEKNWKAAEKVKNLEDGLSDNLKNFKEELYTKIQSQNGEDNPQKYDDLVQDIINTDNSAFDEIQRYANNRVKTPFETFLNNNKKNENIDDKLTINDFLKSSPQTKTGGKKQKQMKK